MKPINFFLAVNLVFCHSVFSQQQELPIFNVPDNVTQLYRESKNLLINVALKPEETVANRKKAASVLIQLSYKRIYNDKGIDDAGYSAIKAYIDVAIKREKDKVQLKLEENYGRDYVTKAIHYNIDIPNVERDFIQNALGNEFNGSDIDAATRLIKLVKDNRLQEKQQQQEQERKLINEENGVIIKHKIETQLNEKKQLEREHARVEHAFNDAHEGNRQFAGPVIQHSYQYDREARRPFYHRGRPPYQVVDHDAAMIRDMNVRRGFQIREQRNNERNRLEKVQWEETVDGPRHKQK